MNCELQLCSLLRGSSFVQRALLSAQEARRFGYTAADRKILRRRERLRYHHHVRYRDLRVDIPILFEAARAEGLSGRLEHKSVRRADTISACILSVETILNPCVLSRSTHSSIIALEIMQVSLLMHCHLRSTAPESREEAYQHKPKGQPRHPSASSEILQA